MSYKSYSDRSDKKRSLKGNSRKTEAQKKRGYKFYIFMIAVAMSFVGVVVLMAVLQKKKYVPTTADKDFKGVTFPSSPKRGRPTRVLPNTSIKSAPKSNCTNCGGTFKRVTANVIECQYCGTTYY
jgi:hypothetical protein